MIPSYSCKEYGLAHQPDPRSVTPADGAGCNRGTDWILDVSCAVCGRSGSVRVEPADVDFDEADETEEGT